MSEPSEKPDPGEAASGSFSEPTTREELMVGVPVLVSWDQLDIPDLTDEERAAFAAALNDA